MYQFLKFILEMKLYMFRIAPPSIIRSFSLYTQQWYMSYRFAVSLGEQAVSKPVWHIPLLCVLWKTPDDGHRNCPKRVEFHSKNKYEKLVHLVGFIIRNLLRCTVTWTSNLCITIHWPNRVHHTVYTKSHSPVSTTTPCGVHRHDHHGAPSNCNVFVTHKTVTKTCWPLVSYKIVVFQTQKHNFVNP